MLNLNQLALPDNLLVIEEEPIFVDTKLSASIHKDEAQIAQDIKQRRYRTGKVLVMGDIVLDTNSRHTFLSSTTGKKIMVDIGTIVIYDASIADVNDCPIEYENQPTPKRPLIYLNRNFVQAIIEEEIK